MAARINHTNSYLPFKHLEIVEKSDDMKKNVLNLLMYRDRQKQYDKNGKKQLKNIMKSKRKKEKP